MRFRVALAAAALLLSACVFSSETPFFRAREGAAPIADGARFQWVEASEGSDRVVTFRRRGHSYDVLGLGGEHEPPLPGVLIIDIPGTAEKDYIVQARIGHEDEGVAYVFLWRNGDGLRMISDVRAFSATPTAGDFAGACAMRSYNECQFASRADLLRFYRERVHPAFVGPDAREPERFVDLRPANEEARRSMQ